MCIKYIRRNLFLYMFKIEGFGTVKNCFKLFRENSEKLGKMDSYMRNEAKTLLEIENDVTNGSSL